MSKITVRDFSDISQLDGIGKTYHDLPIAFEGTLAECHNYCEKVREYTWQQEKSNIFEGYYVDKDGKCLMLF